MDKTILKDYINLCKVLHIDLILNIADDVKKMNLLEEFTEIEQIANKHNVSVNDVMTIHDVMENGATFSKEPLSYIYNKYNDYKINKKHKDIKSDSSEGGGLGNFASRVKIPNTSNIGAKITKGIKARSKKIASVHGKVSDNGKKFIDKIGKNGKKLSDKVGKSVEKFRDTTKSLSKKTREASQKVDEIINKIPKIENNNNAVSAMGEFSFFNLFGITTSEKSGKHEKGHVDVLSKEFRDKIPEENKERYKQLVKEIEEIKSEMKKLQFTVSQEGGAINDNNEKQITCPCCDCAKDGYIFTDEENQKCVK